MIIVNRYLVPKGYGGITLFPFIFLKDSSLKKDSIFINHEQIHLRQQIELLLVGFYIWYFFSFLYYILQGKSRKEAYHMICFEREAYQYESDLTYLKNRRFWAFLRK